MANRLRATSAAAAAPNRIIIGGAGTGVIGGPLDPELPELVDPLDADDEEEADEVLPEVDPELPDELLLDPFELQPLEDQPLDDQPLLLDP